jgi:hypothetical protein
MDSSDTQGMVHKSHEELGILDNPGDGHSECHTGALILGENVFATMVEASAHQDHLSNAHHPSQAPQRSNISGAMSSAISIADLLNENPRSAKHTHPLQSATVWSTIWRYIILL